MLETAIPLVFEHSDTRRFYCEGGARPALDALLDALAGSLPAGGITVLADDPQAEALARAHGLAAQAPAPDAGPPPADTGPLPPDLEAARRFLAGRGDPADTVLGLSPRALSLSPGLLARALEAFSRGQAPLMLGVSMPRDHPVQYNQYWTLRQAWRLHCLDPDAPALAAAAGLSPAWRCARPCPLPDLAASPARPEPEGLFRIATDRFVSRAAPATPDAPDEVLWERLEGDRARMFFRADGLDAIAPRLVAVAAPSGGRLSGTVAVEAGETVRLRLDAPEVAPGDVLRLAWLGPDGLAGPAVLCPICPDTGEAELPWPPPEAFGALCLRLGRPEAGRYDLAIPFVPDDRVWKVDGKTGQVVDAVTGKGIRGRQDFMEVLRPDGSFFLARREALDDLAGLLERGLAQPFVLEPEESLRVETPADLLLYALRRGERGGGADPFPAPGARP